MVLVVVKRWLMVVDVVAASGSFLVFLYHVLRHHHHFTTTVTTTFTITITTFTTFVTTHQLHHQPCIKIRSKVPQFILSQTSKESCPLKVDIDIDYSRVQTVEFGSRNIVIEERSRARRCPRDPISYRTEWVPKWNKN